MNSTFRLLRALTRTMQKCEWHVESAKWIRVKPTLHICPLMFAAKIATGQERGYYHDCGKALGFSVLLSEEVAKAADNVSHQNPKLRRILLKAARLK